MPKNKTVKDKKKDAWVDPYLVIEMIEHAHPEEVRQELVDPNFGNRITKARLQELWAFNLHKRRLIINITFWHTKVAQCASDNLPTPFTS